MLRNGKLKENSLKRSIFKEIRNKRDEVAVGASIGEDAAVISFSKDCKESDNNCFAITSDPVSFPYEYSSELSVIRSLNNLYAQGFNPIGITLTILLPEKSEESDLKAIMRQAEGIARSAGVQIVGGHTEITKAVNNPVVTVTAFGNKYGKEISRTSGVEPGDDIILTKWIGLEGSSIIARHDEKELLNLFPASFVHQAEIFSEYLSIQDEAFIAIDNGVVAMHDLSSGGVFGALWEMAEASKVGLNIDLMSIPVRQETIEICEIYGLNPYEMASSGSLLIAAKDGSLIVRELGSAGIPAIIIGQATDKNDRILVNEDEIRYLDMPKTDELYKFFN